MAVLHVRMESQADVEAASTSSTSAQRRRVTIVLSVVVAALLVAAVSVGWHRWTHPSIFTGLGDTYASPPLPVGKASILTTVIFPRVDGEGEEVTIEGLSADFSSNSAEAEVLFGVCHMNAAADPIGAVRDPRPFCEDIEAFEPPMSFDYGVAPRSDYLFVTITPTRPGEGHLASVTVDYRRSAAHLGQHGTQTLRVVREINVRER
ncbi:hypothetical protein GCM10009719_25880 [Nocardioides kribbensis]